MPGPQMVDSHNPVITGENSLVRLSIDGGQTFVHHTNHSYRSTRSALTACSFFREIP